MATMQLSWISNWNHFSYFLIYKLPGYFLPSFKSISLSVEKKFKIDLQGGSCGSHLGFLIRTILAIFDFKQPQYRLSCFKSIRLLVQEKKDKRDFQSGGHGGHLWFLIYKTPWYFLLSFKSIIGFQIRMSYFQSASSLLAFQCSRRSSKYLFKMAAMAAILDFRSERFYLFLIYKMPQYFLPYF